MIVLGLEAGVNLFVNEAGEWARGVYFPAFVRRYPFCISKLYVDGEALVMELDRRGFLKEGMFADLAVFDPGKIADRATFEKPHQYAVGMKHVFVNGVHVLKDGEHTGAKPGRALKGAGAR